MNWEDHESKRMESAGMEPLGCERHGWADPRGRGFRAEAESSGATWTGSPKGVFAGRKHHKPRLALNNMTTGVREPGEWSSGPSDIEGKATRVGPSECGQRTSFNRTRVAGHMDEIQGVVASTLKLPCDGASLLANSFGVGFIDWLGWRGECSPAC